VIFVLVLNVAVRSRQMSVGGVPTAGLRLMMTTKAGPARQRATWFSPTATEALDVRAAVLT